jgi:DNA-binding MarR family transcriptional regulator
VAATLPRMAKSFDFRHAPGHLIRRAHQVAVAIFMEETSGFDVTPVQFAIMNALVDDPGEDQVTLARKVAFDAATFGSVIARLETRGWVRREADEGDRRRKRLWVTDEGAEVAQKMKRSVGRVQQRILQPLAGAEREQLIELLDRLVAGHDGIAAGAE